MGISGIPWVFMEVCACLQRFMGVWINMCTGRVWVPMCVYGYMRICACPQESMGDMAWDLSTHKVPIRDTHKQPLPPIDIPIHTHEHPQTIIYLQSHIQTLTHPQIPMTPMSIHSALVYIFIYIFIIRGSTCTAIAFYISPPPFPLSFTVFPPEVSSPRFRMQRGLYISECDRSHFSDAVSHLHEGTRKLWKICADTVGYLTESVPSL